MPKISYKVLTKSFKNEVSKKAYLEATKWLAVKVFGRPELAKNLSVKIEKKEKVKIPTFDVTIFVDIEEEKLKYDFCSKCQRIYNTFYQVDKMHCDECKLNAYHKSNDHYTKGLIDLYTKMILEEKEDEDDN